MRRSFIIRVEVLFPARLVMKLKIENQLVPEKPFQFSVPFVKYHNR